MPPISPMPYIEYEDVKLVNCAECRREILGETMVNLVAQYGREVLPGRVRGMPYIEGRIQGRPYCGDCLRSKFLGRPGKSVEPVRKKGL